MKRVFVLSLLTILFSMLTVNLNAQTCTTTGFIRDGINMTAAVINPTSPVTGPVVATGCNIGVYVDNVDATIDTAEIFGANYFGVLVNGDVNTVSASITNSRIHDIGETPLNGTQHGAAIYFRSFFLTGSASGTISNNTLTNYQKGGIVANGQGVNVAITDNIVTGQTAVTYIAQNGIQVGYGASASVMRNTVTGNAYGGTNNASSGGILVVGGPGYGTCPDLNPCPYTVNTRIIQNTATGNDVGVWLANDPVASPTNIKVVNNVLSNNLFTNVSGCGSPMGYQAGISDEGNNDKIVSNSISGTGYANANNLGCGTFSIDATFAARAKVHANVIPN